MLAIPRQKALRLASIEGRKLLRQQSPCLRLVIVRVGNEMDLDTRLVAPHCDARAPAPSARQQLYRDSRARGSIKDAIDTRFSLGSCVGDSDPARFK